MKISNLINVANKSVKIEEKKRYEIQRNIVIKLKKNFKKLILKKNFQKEKM